MTAEESWRQARPYSDPVGPFVPRHRAACWCGSVAFEVAADPVDAKICHCRQCQTLHGAPFQWAVIFHKHDVRFRRGLDHLRFFSAETGGVGHRLPCKLSCDRCGSPLADEGRRMFLAFAPLFDFGSPPQVPPTFAPTCHIFYHSRVVDMPDGLPKHPGHKPPR